MEQWRFVYDTYDPAQEGRREALCALGNGRFVTRGAAPDCHADAVHYLGTYLAGIYNRLTSRLDGLEMENEDLVNLPNWLPLKFRIDDDDWFQLDAVEILSYRQELELRRHITRQKEIIAELKRRGHDTGPACDLLAQFESMQALHIAHRDRLRRELGDEAPH